jgi:hypothetical protein
MLNSSAKERQVVSTLPEISSQPVTTIPLKTKAREVVIAPVRNNAKNSSFITSPERLQQNLYIADNSTTPVIDDNSNQDNSTDAVAYINAPAANIDSHIPEIPVLKTKSSPAREVVTNKSINTPAITAKANNYSFVVAPSTATSDVVATPVAEANQISPQRYEMYPMTIESVINSYTHIQKRKKISLEVYFSPTISYRELKENKAFINYARNAAATSGASITPPVSATNYSADVNSSVTHKPDAGLQLGFVGGYPLSRNLRLLGGLQFNISKYDIRAYSHQEELTTIALTNPNGRTNTVYTLTNYRNDGGYKTNWLHNLYFSVSAPIGLEYKIAGRKRNFYGASGTIQPSFIISNRAYLLSTDYKSYAEIPSLIRKWNINTGFELFAGYTTGRVKWKIGPQVRYQVMSSFVKKYPVQEHLFDFGLKLGVMLNK